jgi:hypothetical protein
MSSATGMCDRFDVFDEAFEECGSLVRLIRWMQAFLQAGVVGGDACGTGVPITFHRLNAADGKHEPARRHDEIGAGAESPGDIRRRDQLAGGDDTNAVP